MNASGEPQQWLTYSGAYDGSRFTPLDQINKTNVQRLSLQWVFQTGVRGRHETTPLVIDGVMYLTTPQNHAFARGRAHRPAALALPAHPAERDVALLRPAEPRARPRSATRVHGHARRACRRLDAKTGRVRWDVAAADADKGYSFTGAPLVVKDKVIIGVAGGEYGDSRVHRRLRRGRPGSARGASTRFPAPASRATRRGPATRGSAAARRPGSPASYDPDAEPALLGHRQSRAADVRRQPRRATTSTPIRSSPSIADTGTLKWHFQFTPHDVHDWDSTHTPILFDETIAGAAAQAGGRRQPQRVLLRARSRHRRVLLGRPYTQVDVGEGGGREGRPVVVPGTDPTPEGNRVCPSGTGGTNWHSPSFSPATRLMYFFSDERATRSWPTKSSAATSARPAVHRQRVLPDPGEAEEGAVRAVDPRTGTIKWEFKEFSGAWAGVSSTAGGLVFSGDGQGNFIALDAETGADLWHVPLGATMHTAAISYAVDSRQFITITAGNAVFTFALPQAIGAAGRSRGR